MCNVNPFTLRRGAYAQAIFNLFIKGETNSGMVLLFYLPMGPIQLFVYINIRTPHCEVNER